MKRKQEGKAERNRCYPKGSGGIWLFWSLYQQLPPHGRYPFPPAYTVFLAVKTRTMDPTPPAASAFSCHCNNIALLLSEGLSKPL